MLHKRTIAIAALLSAAGCANRTPNLVPVEQPFDAQMSCTQIRSEVVSKRRLIESYGVDVVHQRDRNAGAVAGGIFFPIMFIHMDAGNATTQEIQAHQARIVHLQTIARGKDCSDE